MIVKKRGVRIGSVIKELHDPPALAWCERGAGLPENLSFQRLSDPLEHLGERLDVSLPGFNLWHLCAKFPLPAGAWEGQDTSWRGRIIRHFMPHYVV